MTEGPNNQKTVERKANGQDFDMYHFFSRKDVIAVGVVILFLLLYVMAQVFGAKGI